VGICSPKPALAVESDVMQSVTLQPKEKTSNSFQTESGIPSQTFVPWSRQLPPSSSVGEVPTTEHSVDAASVSYAPLVPRTDSIIDDEGNESIADENKGVLDPSHSWGSKVPAGNKENREASTELAPVKKAEDEIVSEKREKATPAPTSAPTSSGSGFFNYLKKKFAGDAYIVDLPTNEEKPYFDKERNIWVFPGQDPDELNVSLFLFIFQSFTMTEINITIAL